MQKPNDKSTKIVIIAEAMVVEGKAPGNNGNKLRRETEEIRG